MNCNLCANNCNVNREVALGRCQVKDVLKIARCAPHYFEEPCISGKEGSGTIFFSGCSLRCLFCQNFDVSRNNVGKEITVERLAQLFKQLEDMGVNNINLVNPTHYVPQIIKALDIYRPKIPIVYNTHGYDNVQTIKCLKGYIDVYLPDFKYFDDDIALKYSGIKNYKNTCLAALKEMRAQVKDEFDDRGILKSGLIIRHLVIPKNLKDTESVLLTIKENFPNTMVSVMSQFTPLVKVEEYKELNRRLFSAEVSRVKKMVEDLGFDGYCQDRASSKEEYVPTWDFE